jgi:hypothetical protein
VKSFALVLNVEFKTLGCQWMRWLGGIYNPQPVTSRWLFLLAMGTPDSPVVHQTVTIHCLVRATSSRPLGFGAIDRWSSLSFCSTGQSGVTLDSPVTSDFCAALFTTFHLSSRPLACRGSLLRWGHRTVRWIIAERVHWIPESGLFDGCLSWCTGQCPVRHLASHSQSCSNFWMCP